LRLKVFLPSDIFVDEEVDRVIGEGPEGSFCLLPRHIDYVTALVPGILAYQTAEAEKHFLAVDTGVLVKKGNQVLVSTRLAVRGALGELQKEVKKMVSLVDERETMTRSACAKLEADLVRRFVEFGKNG
jgi:F-type H+-transporting ATPase subunit epsilon